MRAPLLALLLLAPLVQAAPEALEGVVLDEAGEPVPRAAVRLHEAGTAARTDAAGRFTLPRPASDDVLAVALPGAPQSFHHVPAGAARVEARIGRAPPAEERAESFTQTLDFGATVALGGVPAERVSEEHRLPFRVAPGARDLRVVLDWDPERVEPYGNVTLYVDARPRDANRSVAWRTGNAPLELRVPALALGEGGGEWELRVRAADALATDVRATATFHVDYGPPRVKRVAGAPPHAADGPDRGAPPAMDVLDVAFTNETDAEVEVSLRLGAVGTLAPRSLRYAHWVAQWTHAGETYFVGVTAEQPSPLGGKPPRFRAGDCARAACDAAFDVAGTLDWGTPGAIRFFVPKDLAGRPQDGDRLEGLRAFAYESAEPLPVPMRGAPPPGLVDATPAGAGYVVGPDEYAIPADVVAALLRDGPLDALQAAALRRVDDLKGPAPLVVAGVALAGAGGAAWWMLRARAAASPYVTVRVLGRGANGRVVLARHRVLGHHVAIKEAWTDGAAPEARERVLREARTLARFSHPNVVRVLDIREEAQGLSIVMEHVAGGSLEARLRDGEPLPLDDALRAWRDVLRGLEAAHGLGIVHRDVKPANVLLTPEGDAKLGDFGLARAVHDATLDGEGAGLAGTPTYMAPEQIRGDAPTPASDVFAAGALAYRLLSGRALVDTSRCRTPWDVLVARQAAGPALPLPGVPPPVNELLAACLDDDPDRRPVAAAALRTLEDVTGAGRR